MLRSDLASSAPAILIRQCPRFLLRRHYILALVILTLIVSSLPYGGLLAQELDDASRRIARAISAWVRLFCVDRFRPCS